MCTKIKHEGPSTSLDVVLPEWWRAAVVLDEAGQEAGHVVVGLEAHVRPQQVSLDGTQVEVIGEGVDVDQMLELVTLV